MAEKPSLLYAVKQVEMAVRHHLDDVVRPAGLTTAQYTALTVLERHDGLSASDLARNSFVTQQSMSDLVTALEQAGFIERVKDPTNGRRRLNRLTERGHQVLRDLRSPVRALEARMLGAFSRSERVELGRALNQCRLALDA